MINPYKNFHKLRSAKGITIVEVLVSIVLLGLMASAGISNLSLALRTAKTTEANYAATSLANQKVETISSLDVPNIDTSLNGTETGIAWNGTQTTFSRTTVVTINSDGSRAVTVSVTSENPNLPISATFDTEFALWE